MALAERPVPWTYRHRVWRLEAHGSLIEVKQANGRQWWLGIDKAPRIFMHLGVGDDAAECMVKATKYWRENYP